MVLIIGLILFLLGINGIINPNLGELLTILSALIICTIVACFEPSFRKTFVREDDV